MGRRRDSLAGGEKGEEGGREEQRKERKWVVSTLKYQGKVVHMKAKQLLSLSVSWCSLSNFDEVFLHLLVSSGLSEIGQGQDNLYSEASAGWEGQLSTAPHTPPPHTQLSD